MRRNREEQLRQYQLVQRCLYGDTAARDMLYHLIHRYLHDKLEFYLKNQCAFLSNSDFEDVISLTIAKYLEDLLYQFACQTMRRNFRCFYYHSSFVSAQRKKERLMKG